MNEFDQTDVEIEFSEQDQADLAALGVTTGDAPEYHTLLEVWKRVLEPAKDELAARVSPQYANRIASSYREIAFADMNEYRDRYLEKVLTFERILLDEIATDADCLSYSDPADDAAENRSHYHNILMQWNLQLLQWEMEWECDKPYAAVEFATLGEVHKMFFGEQGITAHLEVIGFEFSDADQALLAEAINEFRETYVPESEG